MINILNLSMPDVLLITPIKRGDERGFFSETYNRRALAEAGFVREFVQDNHSTSSRPGVLRGLHFQRSPHLQDKLVRCIRGAIFDVAVDVRQNSPTFGRWVGAELSADNWSQLLVPAGFAHGFVTLTEGAEVLYKVSDYYVPEAEDGLAWDASEVGIDWPIPRERIMTNVRDRNWSGLAGLEPLII